LGELSRRGRPWLLVSPLWLMLGLFMLVPLAIVLVYSVSPRPPEAWWTSYARTFDPLYAKIFWRSLWMAVVTTALCLIVSYPAAYFIALLASERRKSLWVALTVIPFWSSFLIRTYAWIIILRSEGLVNLTLMKLGLIHEPIGWLLYSDFAVMIGLVYGELPFMILPIYASLEKLDRTLLEAAGDLGARRRSTFWRVTLPLSAPGIAAGALLVFVPSVGQFVVSDLLGGGKSILMGNVIQSQFTTVRDQPFGSALAMELTFGVIIMLLLYGYYTRAPAHGSPGSAPGSGASVERGRQ
jgi:spermidine/putrescine transport system permease protein